MKTNNDSIFTDFLSAASGTIDYTLTNDYMFRSVMQSNGNVLKALLCALLHLKPEEVVSAEIKNPIELGREIDNKEFQLDIKICMNDLAVINLEMQLRNEHNWPERSLIYLCRLFDDLNSGEDYGEVKPAFQIGIIDFVLFPEHPEFYATYKLMNVKNYHKYSDKFTLHMLNLTQIGMATGEDKAHKIDQWAKLFKATTWEDFKMIAADDKIMMEAGGTLFKLNADEQIRYRCEAREEYRRIQNTIKWQMETQKAALAELKTANAEQKAALAEKDAALAEQGTAIKKQGTSIKKLKTANAKQKAALAEKDSVIAKQEAAIAKLQAELQKKS